MKDFWSKKDPGDKAIIVEIGLAVIAVVLLLVFREAMSAFITTLVTEMTNKISAILSGAAGA